MFTVTIPTALAPRQPPGPKSRFLLGSLPEFRRDMLGFVTTCARTYGDVAAFRLGPRRCALVSHPDLIEQILVTQARQFIKHFVLRLTPIVLGQGLLSSEGDFWLRQRRLAQPAFHRDRVHSYGAIMVDYTERLLAEWRDGEERHIHTDMMRLTLEIVAKVLFDADVASDAREVGEALRVALEHFKASFGSLVKLPLFLPTPANLRLKKAVRRLDTLIHRFIDQRRVGGPDRGDLLSRLLHARDEDDGSRMTDQQVRDEMMTLFLAGHETTAIALAWTWYLIASHPEVETRLLRELTEVLGDRSPSVADLPKLKYTEQVVLESMRLYPPAYVIGREPIHDCVLGGYKIRAGQTIFMAQWVVHRDPRFFDNPDEFRPERWAADKAKHLPKYAYFPFGAGPRVCIGNTFAMMETCLIVATIARNWRFRLTPGHPVEPQPLMTLRPAHGIKGTVERR
jgi:cytochrome P450